MGGVFRYANPPVIRWGPGSATELRTELDRLGVRRPAVVTTRSLTGGGMVDEVMSEAGGPAGVATVGQHAPVADIDAAVAALAPGGPDGIVSIGGGSPIDAAKVIGLELAQRVGHERLPHVAIPTTLSVAELATGAGFTDPEGNKVGRRDAGLLPDVVIYDGTLAVRTPLELWLATGIRALDHGVEGFLSRGEHPLPDVLAVESIRRLFASLPAARERPDDADVRTENQLAAWFGYLLPGPSAAGLSHMLGKQIGSRHRIGHGVTSCLLLPHVLRYRSTTGGEGERAAALARATGLGTDGVELADAIARLIATLGLPHHLSDFGLSDDDLRRAADGLGDQHPVEDLVGIYRSAL